MKRSPIRRKKALPPGARLRPKRKKDPITAATDALLLARSGGLCEICRALAEHRHHRRLRRSGDHRVSNILMLCASHHSWAHTHVAEAMGKGWIVSQQREPEQTPVALWDGWWLLNADGTRTPHDV
jgi:hypothetical protein